jgi:hypothetical protein
MIVVDLNFKQHRIYEEIYVRDYTIIIGFGELTIELPMERNTQDHVPLDLLVETVADIAIGGLMNP